MRARIRASVMQIGQILVEQRCVAPRALASALADQAARGMRICSLLIARGQLDPDDAARALATQHGVPGVLQKHLVHREPALAAVLPAALARTHVALPIGRTRNREVIVCVRDPSPALGAVLAAAAGGPVLIAVAPAHQLEQLVAAVYPATPDDAGVDVDLSTRPIAIVRDLGEPADPDEVEVDLRTQRVPVIGDVLDDPGTLTLVELDDERVARDPSQSGQHPALPRRTREGDR